MPCAPRTASLGQDFSDSARCLYSVAVCAGSGKAQARIAVTESAVLQIAGIFIMENDTTKFDWKGQASRAVGSGSIRVTQFFRCCGNLTSSRSERHQADVYNLPNVFSYPSP